MCIRDRISDIFNAQSTSSIACKFDSHALRHSLRFLLLSLFLCIVSGSKSTDVAHRFANKNTAGLILLSTFSGLKLFGLSYYDGHIMAYVIICRAFLAAISAFWTFFGQKELGRSDSHPIRVEDDIGSKTAGIL